LADVEPESGDVRPLDTGHLSTIDVNYPQLVDLLDPNNGLTAKLLATNCISWQQKDHIHAGNTKSEKAKRQLNILRRKSVADFKKFINLLGDTQPHLAFLLEQCSGIWYGVTG
jgi:hypothetical protein